MANQTEVGSQKIKTSHITNTAKLNELVFDGITYTKVMQAPTKFKYNTISGKRDCILWICVEAESKLPAKVVLVPEIK